ncbi:MAG: AAC(3) family N-acetyltransferase [Magnetospirillum sp.]|nr:AAC(3) family N-acetyltransferase [Magnetospirillum sp.]
MSGVEELCTHYRHLGVERGRIVYVASDFGRMRENAVEAPEKMMSAHLEVLCDLVGSSGAIVVPTASLNLCNTDIAFDPANTPSQGMGVFSEFVRRQPGALRSFHPFWSVASMGGVAASLVSDVSRHSFGAGSVWSRLVDADALSLHVGVHPRLSFSVIHHVELAVGVPYRYTKEFMHPVRRTGIPQVEPFYHFVTYRDADIERDGNVKIFANFAEDPSLRERQYARGRVFSFSMRRFFDATQRLLVRDIYAWLRKEPTVRPYRFQ